MKRDDDVYEQYYRRQIYTYDEGDDGDRMGFNDRVVCSTSCACVCSALCGVHSFANWPLRICGLLLASGGTMFLCFDIP